jgi:hypothetical protein
VELVPVESGRAEARLGKAVNRRAGAKWGELRNNRQSKFAG